MSPPIPSPGQIVSVRHRSYIVQHVARGSLEHDVRRSLRDGAPHHLVSLQSLDDDAPGEELQVLWELEPGARVFERSSLPEPGPDGCDDPRRLDALLDAVRWGAVASADLKALHAPFRSGIKLEEYQLDPLIRALEMPRVSLLIADDVGLGKTIEAGLVVQEMLLRHRARTVLVVCPAGLQLQWRDQMRDKFGLEFRIVDTELMRDLRRRRGPNVNPWTHFPRLITSIDFLKRDRPLRLMKDCLPDKPRLVRALDLLIVDEAHNVAPSGRTHYTFDTRRTKAIKALVPHCEHKLFLSATPHNGFTASFSALLELLDDRRFQRQAPVDRERLKAVMVRRLKSNLTEDELGERRFATRALAAIEVDYPEHERDAHRKLIEYGDLRRRRANGDAEHFATEFVLKLLKKRLFSCPEAFRLTLERHLETLLEGRKSTAPKRPIASLKAVAEQLGRVEDDGDDDEIEQQTLETTRTTTGIFSRLEPAEEGLLRELIAWSERVAGTADAKATRLLEWLDHHIRPARTWTDQRVIIFTEYRATQKWLLGLLATHGYTEGDRVQILYGGMNNAQREEIKAAFQSSPDQAAVRILLATDAASEGIDLQNYCSRLIHYDIPWNPSRLEQRNGRIDRHGQRAAQVDILHFVSAGFRDGAGPERPPGSLEGDLEFLARTAHKVEQIREDLGTFGEVLSRQVEEAMLGKRRALDLTGHNTRAETTRATLSLGLKLRDQLERFRKRLSESREHLQLAPSRLRAVVDVAFELAGHPALRDATLPDTGDTVHVLPHLTGSWAACAIGLEHPHTSERRPITFDPVVARDRDDVVLVHLGSTLMQMCLRLLRAQIWAAVGEKRERHLKRWTVRVVPDDVEATPVLIAHARLVILGADHSTLHEEVVLVGGHLTHRSFRRIDRSTRLRELLDKSALTALPPSIAAERAEQWPIHRPSLEQALSHRKDERTAGLRRILSAHCDADIETSTQLFDDLQRAIEGFLRDRPPPQLDLFEPDARDQYVADRDAYAERLAKIPEERERELAAIRRRYADPVAHVFPVALTYLVPESMRRKARA